MNIYKIVLACLIIQGCNTSSIAKKEEPIKNRTYDIMSYNIHYGVTTNGEFDISKAGQTIKLANPDFVMLQEVDKNTERTFRKDLATELGVITGMIPIFGKSIDYQGGEYGNAILSKYPIIKSKVHLLPFINGTEQRSALEVLVKVDGDTIRFVSTHFDSSQKGSLRVKQSKYINSFFNDDIPTLLAGDLNAVPDSEEIKLFQQNWSFSFDKGVFTFPSKMPIKKIDYILYKPIERWKVIKSKIIEDSESSDHVPLITTLELLKE